MSRRRRGDPRAAPLRAAAIPAILAVIAACDGGGGARRGAPPFPGATIVLGHATFAEGEADARGLRPGALSGLHFDGSTLYVADPSNHRVLVLDGIPASDFAAADRVLGQEDLDRDEPNAGGLSASSLNRPAGVFSDGQRLYVCDSQNHRVLVWDSPPAANGAPADHVLGQPDLVSGDRHRGRAGPGADTLSAPIGVHGDGARLYVSDTDNSRVLVWDLPIDFGIEGPPADAVLGQADFASGQGNRGGAVAADTLQGPYGLWSDGTTLAVADTFNHRVLLWTIPPVWTDGEPAAAVLGQPNLVSSDSNNDDGSAPLCPPEAAAAGRTRRTCNLPSDVVLAGGRTFVADRNNNRVLIHGAAPPATYACAGVVLGQPDGTSGTANNGGIGPTSLRRPGSIFADATRLLVYDETNARVKVHSAIPTADNAPADVVFGQPDFTSGLANHRVIDAASFHLPAAIAASEARLAVADSGNNRVLIWAPLPDRNGQPADIVIGQTDFGTVLPVVSPTGLNGPTGAALGVADSMLFVADRGANRVLVYDAPFTTGMAARAAIGQPTMSSNLFAAAANRLYRPASVAWDGSSLWVADEQNHRVLRFDPPFSTDQAAAIVLGQPDLASGGMNGGGSGDRSLDRPVGVSSNGKALLVADRGNHRVLVWNDLPGMTNDPATAVIGQTGFDVPGQPAAGASGMESPIGVSLDGGAVLVHDGGNHRILRWDAIPGAGAMGPPADAVRGQRDFAGTAANAGGVSETSLDLGVAVPASAARTPDRLFASDPQNARVLGF